MYRLALLSSVLFLLCNPAWSGAWLREKGKTFTATSVSVFKDGPDFDYKTSLYSEWGAREKLTLGVDVEGNRDLYGHAFVFARVPIADIGPPGRFATELGVGVHHRDTETWPLYKLALAYGRGFESRWGYGWLAIDTALEYRDEDALIRKLDLTTGLSADRRLNPLLQIETSYVPDRPFYWSARPWLMYRTKSGKTTWIFGVERNSVQQDFGLKFALWLSR